MRLPVFCIWTWAGIRSYLKLPYDMKFQNPAANFACDAFYSFRVVKTLATKTNFHPPKMEKRTITTCCIMLLEIETEF